MLASLNIKNFVLVESLELDFQSGFSALTGETGAGKSILIDALQMLFGARTDTGFIRQGKEKSELSAAFTMTPAAAAWLEAQELQTDEHELVIRRTLDTNGRSKAWINGSSVTLAQLKELSQHLVLVHGQHAHQSLTRKGAQLAILDAFGKLEDEVGEVRQAWRNWRSAHEALAAAVEKKQAGEVEKERLVWFLEGFNSLNAEDGEWQKINEEHTRLSRFTDIQQSCEAACAALTEEENSALELVDHAVSQLENVADADKVLADVVSKLIDARELIDDASGRIEHHLSRLDFDEERFGELDERISLYLQLSSKHRIEPQELYAYGCNARLKLEELEEQFDIEALKAKTLEAKKAYYAKAEALSARRKECAADMSEKITAVMQTLAMAGGGFRVEVAPLEKPSSQGIDGCEFLVAGHGGVDLRPLSKVASGGELARISLAIAVTDSSASTLDTLIFDEVDTGIGGAVAEVVGQLLKQLGRNQQVLCVTHLPQVASRSDHQYKISKVTDAEGAPHSEVTPLDAEERVTEIARMLGGLHITDTTLRHAREMLGEK